MSSAKDKVLAFAGKRRSGIAAKDAAETLGMSVATARKALKELRDAGALALGEDGLYTAMKTAGDAARADKPTRAPSIGSVLRALFEARGVDEVTLEQAEQAVKEIKPSSVFDKRHFSWYKAKYRKGELRAA
jgi:predicted ArsR family transcriptional regulator